MGGLRRIRMLLTWRQRRRELDEEIALHRALLGNDRKFGNELQLRERSRDQWGWRWLEWAAQDLHNGLRQLRRTPFATALALASLTLGIGANLALFSLTDALILRPLPVAHPERLVLLSAKSGGSSFPDFSNPLWEQLRDRNDALSAMLAFNGTMFTVDGEPSLGLYASGSYFPMLGSGAEVGRLFGPRDETPGCPAVADISDAFWHERFAADPRAIGSTLTIAHHPVTVVGVIPPGSFGPEVGRAASIVVPLCAVARLGSYPMLHQPNVWWLRIMGQLKAGQTLPQAQALLNAEHERWISALPGNWRPDERQGFLFSLTPGGHGISTLRANFSTGLLALFAVAGCVLLIACANLAGLMLARTAARRQEIAVRASLGASRLRLVRQLLTESLLLAASGTLAGAFLAAVGCTAVERFLSAPNLPVVLNSSPDLRVSAFAAALTLATAVFIGLLPALRATSAALSRPQPSSASLPSSGRWLVPAQLAAATVLIAAAGLFSRSFAILVGPAKGFSTEAIELAKVSVRSPAVLPSAAIASGLRAIPGILSVGAAWVAPTQGSTWGGPTAAVGSNAKSVRTFWNAVAPGYFALLKTPVLRGRDFASTDGAHAALVTIVNENLAQALFPDQNPLGRQIRRLSYEGPPDPPATIVGVVADAKYQSLQAQAPPTAYFALDQQPQPPAQITFFLRTGLSSPSVRAAVGEVLQRAAPSAHLELQNFASLAAAGVKPERLLATLSQGFGALGLLIAAIGLYGALAYEAAQRRREFGVRAALGAEPGAIRRMVLGRAGRQLLLGVGAGLGLAWLAGRLAQAELGKLLYGVAPSDPWSLGGAALLLVAVGLIAASRPARRAARADPMLALREE